mgnify:FL=1|tara:strand:+ start:130 stop:444 length:315 start_codon:yes stop_codon:yes gene_type:complete
MQPKKTNSYNYDSVKAHYAKYKDSIAVDWQYNVETGSYKTIYKAKGENFVDENTIYIGLQDYIVPVFFAIIISFFIFGSLVMQDNSKAEKENKKESLLDFLNKK